VRLESEDGVPQPQSLWAVLNRGEAMGLLQSLSFYFEENPIDPGWHTHIEGTDCSLAIAIEPPTASIYIELMDEGVSPVWRPVTAHVIDQGEYILPPTAPEGESWAFPPGSVVRCDARDDRLFAVERLR
jgi:hypothetical protein